MLLTAPRLLLLDLCSVTAPCSGAGLLSFIPLRTVPSMTRIPVSASDTGTSQPLTF